MARNVSKLRVALWIVLALVAVGIVALLTPAAGFFLVRLLASARADANRTPSQIAVDEAVAFHEKYYNASKEGTYYDEADPALKKEIAREDFFRLMESMHHRLGDWQYTATNNNPNRPDGGATVVDVNCTSGFAKGTAAERMRYLVSDRKAKLQSFHIDLPEPGTNPTTNP